jgi:hypothetical protein
MKELFKTILTTLPKNVLVLLVIVLGGVATKMAYNDIKEAQHKNEAWQRKVMVKIDTVAFDVKNIQQELANFKGEQKTDHVQINTTLGIIKKAQNKTIQTQIEQSNQIFDELKRRTESYYPIQPIWADSVLAQKKSLTLIYSLGNGNKF